MNRPSRRGFPRLPASGLTTLAVLLNLLLADVAIETFIGGSPLRWWATLVAATYLGAGGALWLSRHPLWLRTGSEAKATLSFFVLFGLLTLTAWLPGGLTNGLKLLTLSTSTLLAVVTGAGVVYSGLALMPPSRPHPAIKWLIIVLTAYAGIAFLWAVFAGTPYPTLFGGKSFWIWLPAWLQGAFIGALVIVPLAIVFRASPILLPSRPNVPRALGFKQVVAPALVLAIVVAALKVSGGPVISSEQVSDRGPGTKLQDLSALQLPVPRTFDLTHVDPAYFTTALGNDPARIFDFVRDNIAFETYTGLLRGPRGTLLAMAGNSVDRAALLASMLQDAGQRIRYVRGTLEDREARRLVTSMWGERPRLTPSKSHPSAAAQQAWETLAAAIKRDYRLLRDYLKTANSPDRESPVSLGSLVKEASAHYWIQWLKNSTWVDLDPSFSDATPGRAYTRAKETFDALPDALFHRVTIRLQLEEYTGDIRSSRDILSYTGRASDLSGVDLMLAHQPENWKGPATSLQSALSSAIQSTSRVKPVLVIGRKNWVVGEPFRQKSPTGQGIGGIGDLLSGAGTRNPVPIATAESLQFDFSYPGGSKVSIEREIFDVVGSGRRATNKNLTGSEIGDRTAHTGAFDVIEHFYVLFFTTGRLDPSQLRGVAEERLKNGKPLDLSTAMQRINLSLVAISDGLLGGSRNLVFYPDSPRVVITELSTTRGNRGLAIDLRRNYARGLASEAHPQQTFLAQVFRGVVDGSLERVIAELVAHEPGVKGAWSIAMSTSALFEQANATRTPVRLLTPQDTSFGGGLPENTLAMLRADLAQGYLALAPQRTIAIGGTPRFAWWRIDRRSGETIAVTDEGLYEAAIEQMQLLQDPASGEVWIMDQEYVGGVARPTGARAVLPGIERLNEFIYEGLAGEGDWIINLRPYPP